MYAPGVMVVGAAGVVPAPALVLLLPPPPQAVKTEVKMTANPNEHSAEVCRNEGNAPCDGCVRWDVLQFVMVWPFSSSVRYFIVGRMNAHQIAPKLSSFTHGFGLRLTQWCAKFRALPLARQSLAGVLASLFMLCMPHAAHAEWQKVVTFDSGTIYVDDASTKKAGYVRTFWSLLDYKTTQKSQRGAYYSSTRTNMEIDCRKQMVHILQFSMHSGPMLTGEIIDSQGVMREWQTIPPDTPLVNLYQHVCK
jgi:hypothetical protein